MKCNGRSFGFKINPIYGEKDQKWKNDVLPIGHRAYAIKQQKIWDAFVKKSSDSFEIDVSTIAQLPKMLDLK